MRFRILGCLEVETSTGDPVLIGAAREQRLLAVLLLDNQHAVSMTRLSDALWDATPPPTAEKQVRNLVSRVRRRLSADRHADLIDTIGDGYRIRVPEADLDAAIFSALTARAARLAKARDLAPAAETFRAALELWRGPALSGLTGQVIEAAARSWDERRVSAEEAYLDLLLEQGRHDLAVPLLVAITGRDPLRQKPVGQLMTALHRSGRQSEALDLYRSLRRRLAEEFGLDPAPEIDQIHQQILAGTLPSAPPITPDPAATGTRIRPRPVLATPRQLPASLRYFVGRADHLRQLDDALGADPGCAGTMLITAIDGTAGIGKTALAVHWAWANIESFDGGQLYVNLHGFAPSRPPLDPAVALRGFLDALGVAPSRVPPDLNSQIGLYRSLLADLRMLVVLDNAHDAAQVRPLLPGGRRCTVLITSRRRLTGLMATEGAVPVALGLLTPAEALELLAGRTGRERLVSDPAAADSILELCAGLPLALSIAAAHIAARPDVPLRAIATSLCQEANVLDALDTGDPGSSPRTVFSWSYQSLSAPAARMFRLLGLHPGPVCSLPSAAQLAELPESAARGVLTELVASAMVAEVAPSRYRLHDLLAAYSAEVCLAHEEPGIRRGALTRVLEHYQRTALHAARLLDPTRSPNSSADHTSTLVDAGEAASITTHEQAQAWFEAESPTLIAAAARAFDSGLDSYAWQIPWSMTTFFDRRGRWSELVEVLGVALVAARRAADAPGEARALRGLGNCAVLRQNFAEAETHFRAAVEIYRTLEDSFGQAMTRLGLSWAAARDGRHDAALEEALQSLGLLREIGNRAGEANALNAAAWQYAKTGRYEEALEACLDALAIQAELDDRQGKAATLDTLGFTCFHLTRYQESIRSYREALNLREDLGDQYSRAGTLIRLGDAHEAAGEVGFASDLWREALTILEELDHPDADDVQTRLASVKDDPGS